MELQILICIGVCMALGCSSARADQGWEVEFEALGGPGLDRLETIERLKQLNAKYPDFSSDNRKQADELLKLSQPSINKCTKLNIATQLSWPARFSNEHLGSLASGYRDEQIKMCIKYFEDFIRVAMKDVGLERATQLRSLAKSMLALRAANSGRDLNQHAIQQGILLYLKRSGAAMDSKETFGREYQQKVTRLCRAVEATNISNTITSSYSRIYTKSAHEGWLDGEQVELAKGADFCHSILVAGFTSDQVYNILSWMLQRPETVPT